MTMAMMMMMMEKFAPLEAIRIELRAEIMCKGVACDR